MKKNVYYYFMSGKVVIRPQWAATYVVAEWEAKYGELLWAEVA